MQPRKPMFQDILNLKYISQEKLHQFMRRLTTDKANRKSFVTLSTNVDQPVYCDKRYYYQSALCCAVQLDDVEMTKALLAIGANPNLTDAATTEGCALSIAVKSGKPKADILLKMLLAVPQIELYVIASRGISLFSYAKGSVSFVLKLLEADPLVVGYSEDEKHEMSTAIAKTTLADCSTYQTNSVVCEILKKVYPNEEEQALLENEMKDVCPMMRVGQRDLASIVWSYLFKPKPLSLRIMENWQANCEPERGDAMKYPYSVRAIRK